jgi:hypothetical protein
MRSAADFEIPNNSATCRNVRFVRQYVATGNTRSSNDSRQGRPRWTSPPRRRTNATNLMNCNSLSPENGSIHLGSSAEITPPMPSQRNSLTIGCGTTSSLIFNP